MSYSAIVLDEASHKKLKEWAGEKFKTLKADGWDLLCHHMTIKMGELPSYLEQDLKSTQTLTVEAYGFDDKVIAVRVSGYFTTNDTPHVTVAVNRANGGKPVMSNKLTKWQPLVSPFKIKGTVQIVQ